MAGAGGGGFMYVLMKEPDTGAEVARRVLEETNVRMRPLHLRM